MPEIGISCGFCGAPAERKEVGYSPTRGKVWSAKAKAVEGVLDQAHRIPLKRLVCISEKTFLHLKNVFDGLLPPRRWPRRLRRSRPTPAVSVVGLERGGQRPYEPSPMVNVWSLRLGVESRLDGWLRAWRWRRDQEEIGPASWRRWLAIRG